MRSQRKMRMRYGVPGLLVLAHAAMAGNFEAHEWGTFTALVGSDGVPQHGMYHEDEALPDFVHPFGETQSTAFIPPPSGNHCHGKGCFDIRYLQENRVTEKMETPVIYFYGDNLGTSNEIPVTVDVLFPEGVISQTYPAPVSSTPTNASEPVMRNGSATFDVSILPVTASSRVPVVPAGNIYAHARHVPSQVVRAGQEEEKFIFYRGLGTFTPRLTVRSRDGGVTVMASKTAAPQAVFLVDGSESGHTRLLELAPPKAGDMVTVDASVIEILKTRTETSAAGDRAYARSALESALQRSGLYPAEATAMVDTWEHGYFRTPGLRVLYVLPREEVDGILKLSFSPAPTAFERAFVGRIEIMTDLEEQAILADIVRLGETFAVSSLGRFAEPKLRRLSEVALGTGAVDPKLMGRLVDQAMVLSLTGQDSLQ